MIFLLKNLFQFLRYNRFFWVYLSSLLYGSSSVEHVEKHWEEKINQGLVCALGRGGRGKRLHFSPLHASVSFSSQPLLALFVLSSSFARLYDTKERSKTVKIYRNHTRIPTGLTMQRIFQFWLKINASYLRHWVLLPLRFKTVRLGQMTKQQHVHDFPACTVCHIYMQVRD